MNIYAMITGAIGAVNPYTQAQLFVSTGDTTAGDYAQVPTYAAPVAVMAQVQALTASDLRQIDMLNIQSVMCAIYIRGDMQGVVRAAGKGGDKLVFTQAVTAVDVNGDPVPSGTSRVWLVTQVLETWPDFSKCAATMQLDTP